MTLLPFALRFPPRRPAGSTIKPSHSARSAAPARIGGGFRDARHLDYHRGVNDESLGELAARMEAEGLDATELRDLEAELETAERPPGFLRRFGARARDAAARTWAMFVGELRESGEAMRLISGAMRGERQLTPEERDKVRAQVLDLVRVFPAGLIAAANSAFPIPGTGLFTPWILLRLGLMPSHWREAHVIEQLRKKQRAAQAAGQDDAARRLAAVADRIEQEAELRDKVGHDAGLLTAWDHNGNQRWDPNEIQAYKAELAKVKALAQAFPARREWYFSDNGEVFGAERLSELGEFASDGKASRLLVCYAGKSGWVSLAHVLGAEPTFDEPAPTTASG